jgi:hypothetical protein
LGKSVGFWYEIQFLKFGGKSQKSSDIFGLSFVFSGLSTHFLFKIQILNENNKLVCFSNLLLNFSSFVFKKIKISNKLNQTDQSQ